MASALDNTITSEPTGRGIGTTTIGAAAGNGIAGAFATLIIGILVFVHPPIIALFTPAFTAALIMVIGFFGTILGGYITPTNKVKTKTHIIQSPITSQTNPNFAVEGPYTTEYVGETNA